MAIAMMAKSAARFGYETLIVTDERTQIAAPWLRVGSAMDDGLMMWLLKAQAAAIKASEEPAVMVSPDTLISGRLDFLMGSWDLSILTRTKPKPIVNSVIGFRPGPAVARMWDEIVDIAAGLPDESREWGADIDAVVNRLDIRRDEDKVRVVDGVTVKLIPLHGKFKSVPREGPARMLGAPIWDFKGPRKARMVEYAGLLNAHI